MGLFRFLIVSALPAAGIGAGVAFGAAPAQAILRWDFTVDFGNGTGAAGSFITDGDDYESSTLYTISSITGSQGGIDIIGLSAGQGADPSLSASNTFVWEGTNGSPIRTNGAGISWLLDPSTLVPDGSQVIPSIFQDGPFPGVFLPADTWAQYFGNPDNNQVFFGSVASTSLTPNPLPEPVPGPLPLLGAGAAFGWSRQLRRRTTPSTDKLHG